MPIINAAAILPSRYHWINVSDNKNKMATGIANTEDAKLDYIDRYTGKYMSLSFKKGESYLASKTPEGKWMISFLKSAVNNAIDVAEEVGAAAL